MRYALICCGGGIQCAVFSTAGPKIGWRDGRIDKAGCTVCRSMYATLKLKVENEIELQDGMLTEAGVGCSLE